MMNPVALGVSDLDQSTHRYFLGQIGLQRYVVTALQDYFYPPPFFFVRIKWILYKNTSVGLFWNDILWPLPEAGSVCPWRWVGRQCSQPHFGRICDVSLAQPLLLSLVF